MRDVFKRVRAQPYPLEFGAFDLTRTNEQVHPDAVCVMIIITNDNMYQILTDIARTFCDFIF